MNTSTTAPAAENLTCEKLAEIWEKLRPKKPLPIAVAVCSARAEHLKRIYAETFANAPLFEVPGTICGLEIIHDNRMPPWRQDFLFTREELVQRCRDIEQRKPLL
jgi:hypothetical protein